MLKEVVLVGERLQALLTLNALGVDVPLHVLGEVLAVHHALAAHFAAKGWLVRVELSDVAFQGLRVVVACGADLAPPFFLILGIHGHVKRWQS